jgi:hypothetical protein
MWLGSYVICVRDVRECLWIYPTVGSALSDQGGQGVPNGQENPWCVVFSRIQYGRISSASDTDRERLRHR